MTLYSIYSKPEDGPEAIAMLAEKFSFSAFVFAPLWALAKGAFAYLVLWSAVVALLAFLVRMIGLDAAVLLYLVFALWTGFAASQIAARALERRNWLAQGTLVASDIASAERLWLERTYGARP